MKYRLKKNLPFAKKGEMVSVNPFGVCYCGGWVPIGNYRKLMYDGWIEEVKPRENTGRLNNETD